MPIAVAFCSIRPLNSLRTSIRCTDSSSNRGFGRRPPNGNVKNRNSSSQSEQNKLQRNLSASQSGQLAPGLGTKLDKGSPKIRSDVQFDQKLEAVRRSALNQKKTVEQKEFGAIDYDAPTEPKKETIGLGTKIGVGVAVVVFGLVFALGDFFPSGSFSSNEDDKAVKTKLPKEEIAILQAKLQEFEATLSSSPKDQVALEGAAVALTELGEYTKAAARLEDLSKEKPNDPDVFRLLGEVKYELKDYESSVAAYKTSRKIGNPLDFETLRGLTNALLAANRPDEAVQFLLEARARINTEKKDATSDSQSDTDQLQKMDAVQVDLLLGKAYSDWGHVSDAVSVYDQLISSNPNDFRGYLAKGIILKQNGSLGEAERMFIQARFFAPEKAKTLVDRYSRQ
ncbi:hypothetical protein V2J09_002996 [Rumex salicifolius]